MRIEKTQGAPLWGPYGAPMGPPPFGYPEGPPVGGPKGPFIGGPPASLLNVIVSKWGPQLLKGPLFSAGGPPLGAPPQGS